MLRIQDPNYGMEASFFPAHAFATLVDYVGFPLINSEEFNVSASERSSKATVIWMGKRVLRQVGAVWLAREAQWCVVAWRAVPCALPKQPKHLWLPSRVGWFKFRTLDACFWSAFKIRHGRLWTYTKSINDINNINYHLSTYDILYQHNISMLIIDNSMSLQFTGMKLYLSCANAYTTTTRPHSAHVF